MSTQYEAEQRELTEFVKTEQAAVDTYEQDTADRKSKSFGTSSGSWSRTIMRKLLNGKEKAERHSLSTMPPCKY